MSAVQCGEFQWPCMSQTQCVPQSWHCDGTKDCTDESDEAVCESEHTGQSWTLLKQSNPNSLCVNIPLYFSMNLHFSSAKSV